MPLIVSVSCLSQSDRESKRCTLRNRDTWTLLGNEYGVCVRVTVSFGNGTQWIKEKMGMRFFFSCFCSIICTLEKESDSAAFCESQSILGTK